MIFTLIIIDMLLILGFALPVRYLYLKWNEWVSRKEPYMRAFIHEKRFGWKSWVRRSFQINASMEEVHKHVNDLSEMSIETLLFDPVKSKTMSPILAAMPNRKFATGIEINWLNPNAVEINARQYADWPANEEDDINLPIKQRQRLVEHLVFYIEPGELNTTKISYEMETPVWIYVMLTSIILLLIAATWGMLNLQMTEAFIKAAGKNHKMIIVNTSILWIPLAAITTRILSVFRLQSISLIDNVISTFGKMIPVNPKNTDKSNNSN
ncbi:MAG: hypothetical protein ACYC0V_14310 [Armatimonadota bacterium]